MIWYALRYGYISRRVNYRAVFYPTGRTANLSAYQPITTLEGAKQLLPMGPVAAGGDQNAWH